MISILKKMLPAIENWPEEDQEALAEAARQIEAARAGFYLMTAEEEQAVGEGLAEADSGVFVDGNEITAIWRHFKK